MNDSEENGFRIDIQPKLDLISQENPFCILRFCHYEVYVSAVIAPDR